MRRPLPALPNGTDPGVVDVLDRQAAVEHAAVHAEAEQDHHVDDEEVGRDGEEPCPTP